MRPFSTATFLVLTLCLPSVFSAECPVFDDYAQACYAEPIPNLVPSTDNRTVPWGTPSITIGNTTCCSSLDDVRAGIDSIDSQLLELLSQRAAYVREATRFKATRDVVDVLARDQQVIDGAVNSSTQVNLPETISRAVFTTILNASVSFELCVFDSFKGQ